jgi:hypothetical protein
MKCIGRLNIVAILLVFVLGIGGVASAYLGQSSHREKTADGISYEFWNLINTTPQQPSGSNVMTCTNIISSSSVPSGHMGCSAELYDRSGDMILASEWVYNPQPTTFCQSYHTTFFVSGDGVYVFGRGITDLWNGNGYDTYYTDRTPNVLVRTIVEDMPIATNRNNQTYGSAFYAASPEEVPDLIAAKGIDGTQGYVYATDVYGVGRINSPEELSFRTASTSATTIPLYDSDGTTVIGAFPIVN